MPIPSHPPPRHPILRDASPASFTTTALCNASSSHRRPIPTRPCSLFEKRWGRQVVLWGETKDARQGRKARPHEHLPMVAPAHVRGPISPALECWAPYACPREPTTSPSRSTDVLSKAITCAAYPPVRPCPRASFTQKGSSRLSSCPSSSYPSLLLPFSSLCQYLRPGFLLSVSRSFFVVAPPIARADRELVISHPRPL